MTGGRKTTGLGRDRRVAEASGKGNFSDRNGIRKPEFGAFAPGSGFFLTRASLNRKEKFKGKGGETRMKRFLLCIVLVLLVSMGTAPAWADLYDWSSVSPIINDENSDLITPAQDILQVWYASDADYHYFRMDLEATPSIDPNYTDYAPIYGIYIDAISGGVDGPNYSYIPNGLTGIDFALDSHYNPNQNGFTQHDFHDWSGGSLSTTLLATGDTDQNSNQLEWRIGKTVLGDAFTFSAGTHLDAVGFGVTYDITNIAAVPVPAAAWLLGTGLVAVVGLRRKK